MMDRNEIAERLTAQRPALERLGVESLRVFGSVARGDDRPGSDVDVLVKFTGTPDFDRYMDLHLLLEEAMGRKVDLVTEGGLRPSLRGPIEREAIRVA